MCANTGFGALPPQLEREWAGKQKLLAAVDLAQLEHRRKGPLSGVQGTLSGARLAARSLFALGSRGGSTLLPHFPLVWGGEGRGGAFFYLWGAFAEPGAPLLGSPTQSPPRLHVTAASPATWTA